MKVDLPNFQVLPGTLEKRYLRNAVQEETRSVFPGLTDVTSTISFKLSPTL